MNSRSRRLWPLIAVAVLVVLNVGLILALVLRPTAPATSEPSTPPSQTSTAPSPTASEPEETTSPSPDELSPQESPTTPEPTPIPGPAERLLANAGESIAWRATVGTCDTPGELERTTDGGETWESLESELAPLSRVRVLGPESLFVVGGADCEATYAFSADGGDSWESNDDLLNGSWYLDPADPDQLGTPTGPIDAPCEVARLVGLDNADGAVLCTDGEITMTRDGGQTWEEAPDQAPVLAIGPAEDGYIGVGAEAACEPELSITSFDRAGSSNDTDICIEMAVDGSEEVAVSADSQSIWLWADENVLMSTDGGATW